MLRRGATRLKIKSEDQEELKGTNATENPQSRAFNKVAGKGKGLPPANRDPTGL